jgi:hypothetical protein
MTLRKKQSRFVVMVALLLQYAHSLGYELTFGDAFRDPRCPYGSDLSLHHQRLAVDLNLFINGKFITDGTGHDKLHDFWDLLGGAERIEHDLNHYSLAHGGRR